ncbi:MULTISPECIES: pyridoxamine 5'-phosphate oxidase family protein [unclassified Rhodococcus (in: high G+C Gram-positive bacteria)]|uniref:pyridoxamine 5'-phosphate oxidase family protein n=1 Tax=unclassified Rhodococcus (in: high G+C Gram-positive bacteria) TaxID=192944 RepID=UPI0009EA9341|nr:MULTISPECIES: pyridoxamine 5'-phosphate oxidase family protein [unclassified Rhodococcus (in: high G+C Gram-positive bacteria)]PBC56419.1 pyridoxamine 5'-phosphate oxidase family protein [Rhodococcus sp. ACPA1]
MTQDEIDSFLAEERTCRVATVDGNGTPHVVPLWFVWDGTCLWLNSIVRSQRWKDITRDPRVSIVIDAGHGFEELRGVEISGQAESVGDVPRGSTVDSRLTEVELRFARKYMGSDMFKADGRHGWLRVMPSKIVSWDFRKAPKR